LVNLLLANIKGSYMIFKKNLAYLEKKCFPHCLKTIVAPPIAVQSKNVYPKILLFMHN
jgi:hypothetical protein